MSDIPLLLVHGPCHRAWCWDALQPELKARGIRAEVLDMPGLGADTTPPEQASLATAADAIRSAVHGMGGRAVLQNRA